MDQASGQALLSSPRAPTSRVAGRTAILQVPNLRDKGEEGEQISNLQQAVIWAEKGRNGDATWVETCTETQFQWWQSYRQWTWLAHLSKYALLVLPIFEPPIWCHNRPVLCRMHYAESVYSWPVLVIPEWLNASLTCLAYIILIWRVYVQRQSLGRAYKFNTWRMITCTFLALGLIGTTLRFFVQYDMVRALTNICSPMVFLCVTRQIRIQVDHIIKALPGFVEVIFALFLFVFLFVWYGMVLFIHSQEGSVDFFNWGDGMAKMWILFTTANSPDAFIPAYNASRWNVVFFLLYLIGSLYMLGNVLLAEVYDSYKRVMRDYFKNFAQNRREAITRAYHQLVDEDKSSHKITPATWRNFLRLYGKSDSSGIKSEDKDDMEYIVSVTHRMLKEHHRIQIEEDTDLDLQMFKDVMTVFFDRDFYISKKVKSEKSLGGFAQGAVDIMEKGILIHGSYFKWDDIVDFLILVDVILTFVVTDRWDAKSALTKLPSFWCIFVISFLWVMAISVKIYSMSFRSFWNKHKKKYQHRIDFVNVYLLFAVELVYFALALAGHGPSVGLERLILLLHIARGLRLLRYFKALEQVGLIIARVVPAFWIMIELLLLVFYIFVVIGQWSFGGLIYASNPALAGTQFAEYAFWSLNFNDVISGFVTLFVLMVVNNWYILADGYMKAAGPSWSYLAASYFVVFFVVCNLVVLNILVALILDVSNSFHDAQNELSHHEEAADLEGQQQHNTGKTAEALMRDLVKGGEKSSSSDDEEESSESPDEDDEEAKQDDSRTFSMSPTKQIREEVRQEMRSKRRQSM